MALSAFKSTSKRGGGFGNGNSSATNCSSSASSSATAKSVRDGGNVEGSDTSKKFIHRRSRSVSAVSRSCSLSGVNYDFSNKRDNPLFNTTSTSPPDSFESERLISGVAKFGQSGSKLKASPVKLEGNGVVSDSRRGRSVSRKGESGNQVLGSRKEVGRSMSRVDTGRRQRSVSRGRHENYDEKTINASASDSEWSRGTRSLRTWSSQHPASEPSDGFASSMQATNWDDAVSTSSFSEAEERTINAVSEQMKSIQGDYPPGVAETGGIYETVRSEVRRAISEIQNDLENVIQRKNPTIIAATDVADIPPDLVNPDAIELVSEIRKEYTVKLKQSQERARKLRDDLAVEEHRGQELSRILEEILPEPKSVRTQRSHPRRKNSVERWKMSKRLTEEAMNYFDECVSISTFDSSDFSSPEDQPISLAPGAPPVGDSIFLSSTCSSGLPNSCSNEGVNHNKGYDNQVQHTRSHEASNFTASSSSKNLVRDQDNQEGTDSPLRKNLQFSFARESTDHIGTHDGIRDYIKKFEKENQKVAKDSNVVKSSYYDEEYYDLQVLNERLLFDKVIFKNRIDSGGLLLCDIGITL